MDDDLNTADAIAAVFELVKFANTECGEENSKEYLQTVREEIVSLCDILGLKAERREEVLDEEIEALIEKRQEARKGRNFKLADEIRDQLLAQGIILKIQEKE